jgi:hypothetical protein
VKTEVDPETSSGWSTTNRPLTPRTARKRSASSPQDMPAQVVVQGEKALGLDMGQVVALLWKDSQETHARLAALEKGKK